MITNPESFIRSDVPWSPSTVCVSVGTFLDRVNGQVVNMHGALWYLSISNGNKLTGRYGVRTQLSFTSFQFFTSSAMSQKCQSIYFAIPGTHITANPLYMWILSQIPQKWQVSWKAFGKFLVSMMAASTVNFLPVYPSLHGLYLKNKVMRPIWCPNLTKRATADNYVSCLSCWL